MHHTPLDLSSLLSHPCHQIQFVWPFIFYSYHFPCSHNDSTCQSEWVILQKAIFLKAHLTKEFSKLFHIFYCLLRQTQFLLGFRNNLVIRKDYSLTHKVLKQIKWGNDVELPPNQIAKFFLHLNVIIITERGLDYFIQLLNSRIHSFREF